MAATSPLRIVVAGASGFIGTELVSQLLADGHSVTALVRHTAGPGEYRWDPASGRLDPTVLDGADAVISLGGASISKIPWTAAYEKELLSSRVDVTKTLVDAMNALETPPATFLSGSAVGFYGDRPGEDLTEESPKGTGVLADIVERWEAEALAAPKATRVVLLRTGLVVGEGGAFGPLGLLTKFGLASRIGSGNQYWPWIALYDEAAAIRHLLTADVSGAVNLEGPSPATSVEITKSLAKAMGRWHILTLPSALISLGMGAAGRELLLPDTRIVPSKLLASGFTHRYATADAAISAIWKK